MLFQVTTHVEAIRDDLKLGKLFASRNSYHIIQYDKIEVHDP